MSDVDENLQAAIERLRERLKRYDGEGLDEGLVRRFLEASYRYLTVLLETDDEREKLEAREEVGALVKQLDATAPVGGKQ
jgi:hypothetical protein